MASGSNIRLNIEYSDYSVGRTLQITVQDWVKGLKTRKVSRLIKFMEDKSDFFVSNVPHLFVFASLLGYSRYPFSSEVPEAIRQIVFVLSISVLMYVLGRFLNNQMFKQLEFAKPLTFIKITAGDESRCAEIKKRQTKRAWLSGFFGVTVLAGLIINIFSTLLLEWFRS